MAKASSATGPVERGALAAIAAFFLLLPTTPGLAATDYPVSTGAAGACDYSGAQTLDTDTTPVLDCTTLTVETGATLTISGSHIADLRATGLVTIDGTIDVMPRTGSADASGGTPGADGSGPSHGTGGSVGSGGTAGSEGGGGGGGGLAGGGGGGGLTAGENGGAGGGAGGAGGYATGGGGGGQPGGTAAGAYGAGGGGGSYGSPGLHVGSGGGGGGSYDVLADFVPAGAGGSGGGALRMVSPDEIDIGPFASLLANGTDGSPGGVDVTLTYHGGPGGGGSGGGILLIAPTVNILASTVYALGGEGAGQGTGNTAGGNGDAGWIDIVANSYSFGGSVISPAPYTSLYSARLTVATSGTGRGTVTSSPAGIDCGGDCSDAFDGGAAVTLSAQPAAGSVFSSWSGACTGTSVSCVVTMNAARSATATFTLAPATTTATTTATTPKPSARCTVPRVVGLALAKARTRIAKAHCKVGHVKKSRSSRTRKGKVLAQDPRHGKRLKAGGKVNLTVGKGPK